MMNEAHNGLRRSIRTRQVGRRVLIPAHDAGVRHLAMEALHPRFAAEANETRVVPPAADGYLAQPEMRDLIAAALDLGWTLIAYEVDMRSKPRDLDRHGWEETNWREDQQARKLVSALRALADPQRLLVWCGNGHLTKRVVQEWRPMGLRFRELSGLEPFAIDQIDSVRLGDYEPFATAWVEAYESELAARGGTAGFLAEDAPEGWATVDNADAFVISLDNAIE
jgi:hypothetical protein